MAAFASTLAVAQQTPSPASVEGELSSNQALSLLKESVVSSGNFSPEEQVDLLLDASKAALTLDKPSAAEWAIQLFGLTQKLTRGHYRSAMQKNALVTLAQLDVAKASELYMQQDDPPEALPAGEQKLRLLVQLAQDQVALKKEKDGLLTASHALDLGEELFALGIQATPGKMASTMPGFDPMRSLSTGMAALSSDIRSVMLTRIMQMRNETLQAHMEVAYAEGVGQAKHMLQ